MLAADELAPDDPTTLCGPPAFWSQLVQVQPQQVARRHVEHTGKAFLGLTFNCCRCHDHMYDPLAQREYYRCGRSSSRTTCAPIACRASPTRLKDGLARVFDAKPDDATYLFVRGNEKNPTEGRTAVAGAAEGFWDIRFFDRAGDAAARRRVSRRCALSCAKTRSRPRGRTSKKPSTAARCGKRKFDGTLAKLRLRSASRRLPTRRLPTLPSMMPTLNWLWPKRR